MVEFDCVDCGYHVYMAFGSIPEPPRCVTCLWISEQPEEEREKLRWHTFKEEKREPTA